ncbi:hypothetical protein K1719_021067 [Acacia pycnantha]|nr:hypothetical protein K1719_021067 [Acacia pycnantha]
MRPWNRFVDRAVDHLVTQIEAEKRTERENLAKNQRSLCGRADTQSSKKETKNKSNTTHCHNLLEDQSQLESGSLSSHESSPYGTFVGVYDGHGGPETSRFIKDHLFHHLKRFTAEQQSMSVDVLRKAFQATEEGFMSVVAKQWQMKPQIAAVGSCCLIVVLKHNVWRVKGLIQVSRSIGDVYLKKAEFNREPLHAKFRLHEPFKRPILSSEPSISVYQLQPHDQFVIFASDGLWEHLSNQEAVDIVQNNPRNASARRLVKAALQEAAKKREMRASSVRFNNISVRGGGITLPPNTLAPCATPTEGGGTIV